MSSLGWLLVGAGAVVLLYVTFVVALVVAGRRDQARALAGFIPDCVVLVRRLLSDPAMPRRNKLLLGGLVLYLASPIDLVPDFIPIAGQLDDALVVALVLRATLRSVGPDHVAEHWPGPRSTLAIIQRLVGHPQAEPAQRAGRP